MLCHVFYYFRNFFCFFFFFNATATTEIYTLSLHDALPISASTAPKALVAAYTARSGAPCWPASEDITTNPPRPRSAIAGRYPCARASGAAQLSATARAVSAGSARRNGPTGEYAALHTTRPTSRPAV